MTAEERIKQVFASFSHMMCSCRNDYFDEDFYKGTINWLAKAEKEVLQILADHVVVSRKELQQKYDEALAEPSDEMDKLANLEKLFEELLEE